jgi:hypothetical protein
MSENPSKSVEERAADVRATRTRLAATIEALTGRTDVRGRARAALERRLRALRATGHRIRVRLHLGGHRT